MSMKNIIPIIVIALLAMASCHRTKGEPEGMKDVAMAAGTGI